MKVDWRCLDLNSLSFASRKMIMFNQFYHQISINSIFPARVSDATEWSHFPVVCAWELCGDVLWIVLLGFFLGGVEGRQGWFVGCLFSGVCFV